MDSSDRDLLQTRGDEHRLSLSAIRAFFRIGDLWSLSADQRIALLGHPDKEQFVRWEHGDVTSLPRDTLERISLLLSIYRAVHTLFPDPEQADTWITRPNAAFQMQPALAVMLRDREGIKEVRDYLEYWVHC